MASKQTKPTHRARGKKRRDWKPDFLAAFESEGTVKAACINAKVHRSTVYQARETDPDFAAAWDEVEQGVTEELEREGMRRALEGSDRMVEFFLRARAPEKYRENVRLEHGGHITHEVEDKLDREIAKLLDQLGAPAEVRALLSPPADSVASNGST